MEIYNIVQYLQQHLVISFIALGLLSLMFGSFLNVVIVRLPIMIEKSCKAECEDFLALVKKESEYVNKDFNLFTPRSHCPKCNHIITIWENIPLISFIFLLGTCRYCKQPISLRYPIIEALTVIISLFIAWHFGIEIKTIYALLLVWILIVQAFIDLEHTFIPDEITMPALWLGLISNCHATFNSPINAILGTILGYLSLWIVYWLFKLITKKEGMGHGDFKLLAMLGAWLGWQYLPLIIIISSLLGTIVGVFLIIKKNKHLSTAIPFGPYLAVAGVIALLYGKEINMLYWQYTGLL